MEACIEPIAQDKAVADGGISEYSGLDLYEVENLNGQASLTFSTKGNPDLTWERSNMIQIGFELDFLKRFTLNVEYFNKITTDLIYARRVAPSNGFALYNVNDGRLQNQGVDFDLGVGLLREKEYYLDLKLNGGFVSNRMLTLPIEPSTGAPKYIDDSQGVYGRMKGRSLYDYYIKSFEGVNPENGRSQWTLFYVDKDQNGTYSHGDKAISSLEAYKYEHPEEVALIKQGTTEEWAEATRHYVGRSALPVLRGGFQISGGYKAVELSIQFIYGLGGYGVDQVYSKLMGSKSAGAENWHKDIRRAWTPTNKHTDVPRLSNGIDTTADALSTRFLTSNSFLNLANVRLSYRLPKAWVETLQVADASVWLSGDNLLLLSARRGYNPATSLSGSSSSLSYSPLSTVTAGVRVSF